MHAIGHTQTHATATICSLQTPYPPGRSTPWPRTRLARQHIKCCPPNQFAAPRGPSRENAAKPMRHRTPTRWAPGPSVCSLMVTSSDPGDGSVRSSTCHKSVAASRLAAVKRVLHDCSLTCTTSELERRNMHGGSGSPCIFQRAGPVELTDDLGPCGTLTSARSTLMALKSSTLWTP